MSRAATRLRWPMLFRLEQADASLFDRASNHFDLHHDYDAPREVVLGSFLAFVGDPPWSPGFLGCDWWTPEGVIDDAVFDELYTFMAMRVHVLEHVRGERAVISVDRWSLPLATRMVQIIETYPVEGGKTRLRYRVAYDPPRVFKAFAPPVEFLFNRWFKRSLEGLERLLVSGGGRATP